MVKKLGYSLTVIKGFEVMVANEEKLIVNFMCK